MTWADVKWDSRTLGIDAVALELGNSPQVLVTHYRELVTREQAQEFWTITPPQDHPKN